MIATFSISFLLILNYNKHGRKRSVYVPWLLYLPKWIASDLCVASILALDFSFSVGFPSFVVCLLGDFVVGLLGDIAFGFDGEEGFGSDGEDCFGPDGDSGEMVAVARVTPQEEDVSGL